jgi:transposase
MAAEQQPSPRRLTITTAYIGIDLHRTVIQICVLDERGERIAEERVRIGSLEEGLEVVAFVRRFALGCRVAVEALGLNRWFVNACREAGLDVLVCDPRKLDLKKLGKKTDRREAREIASRLWLGDLDRMACTYYPSDEEYGRRKLLRVRHRLVQMRQQTINQLRAMLNAYQVPASRGVLYTRPSRERLATVALPVPELQQAFEALLAVLESLQGQIDGLNRRVRRLPREEADVAILANLPGIGAQSAATLLAELGDPKRFAGPRAVAA